MPAPTREEWHEASLKVVHAVSMSRRRLRGRDGVAPSFDVVGFDRVFERVVKEIPVPERWSRKVQDGLAALFEKAPFGRGRYENDRMNEMRALRLGHASLTGDATWVSPVEAACLGGFDLLPVPRRIDSPPRSDDALVVEFCVPFPVLPRRARTMTVPARGRGATVVERVDRAETHEAYVLGFARSEGTVPVLRYDGALFRPVFAPGTVRATTEAEFLAAAQGDDAWADSPFLPLGWQRNFPLSDYARDALPTTEEESVLMEEVLAQAATRCGRLVSIDGDVFRQTVEPEFFVTLEHDIEGRSAWLDWRMGELTSRFSPGPFDESDHRCDWAFGCRMGFLHVEPERVLGFAHEDILVARDVLAMTAKTAACPTFECGVWPPYGEPVDPAAAIRRKLRYFLDCREDTSTLACAGRVDYGPALTRACLSMASSDVEGMRVAFATMPKPREDRMHERAEFGFLRAMVAAGGKALKGEYEAANEVELDLTDL